MIQLGQGNLLKADVEALVNTVNTVGIMGKGVALQFRQAFPKNYETYRKACKIGDVKIGRMFVYNTGSWTNPRYIINFPTKKHWKERTRIAYIKDGLVDLRNIILNEGIRSIAIPPLGCGSGGLKWNNVRPIIEDALTGLQDVNIVLFEPRGAPEPDKVKVATKRPKMTYGRAVLIKLFKNYLLPGYRLTMLEAQKLAYLLQEAGEPLKLEFTEQRYGPYAEKLNHVLQRIEGHFIRGYGDRSRDASMIIISGEDEADRLLEDDKARLNRLRKVTQLIEGFETPYGLELLTTVHWVVKHEGVKADDTQEIISAVKSWSRRKQHLFIPDHIKVAIQQLRSERWL